MSAWLWCLCSGDRTLASTISPSCSLLYVCQCASTPRHPHSWSLNLSPWLRLPFHYWPAISPCVFLPLRPFLHKMDSQKLSRALATLRILHCYFVSTLFMVTTKWGFNKVAFLSVPVHTHTFHWPIQKQLVRPLPASGLMRFPKSQLSVSWGEISG